MQCIMGIPWPHRVHFHTQDLKNYEYHHIDVVLERSSCVLARDRTKISSTWWIRYRIGLKLDMEKKFLFETEIFTHTQTWLLTDYCELWSASVKKKKKGLVLKKKTYGMGFSIGKVSVRYYTVLALILAYRFKW